MRILSILPGSGGSFYCQNCLRDTALAEALRARGHSVTLMPLYLPATASMSAPDEVPVFYGAVSLKRRASTWPRFRPRPAPSSSTKKSSAPICKGDRPVAPA
jgi:hypothetical protein